MPTYNLTYFNVTGRGEVARFLFAIAGVDYEDVRLEKEQWLTVKDKMPFGQIPVLEVDGEMLCQSRAIEAFLARRFGLAGKTDWDQARAAMINDCVEDLRASYRDIYFEKDDIKKVEMKRVFEEGPKIRHLDNFEKLLAGNNGGDGYFVGDEMTYADVAFLYHADMIPVFTGSDVDWEKWPKLKSLRETVGAHPAVRDWIARRPVTVL